MIRNYVRSAFSNAASHIAHASDEYAPPESFHVWIWHLAMVTDEDNRIDLLWRTCLICSKAACQWSMEGRQLGFLNFASWSAENPGLCMSCHDGRTVYVMDGGLQQESLAANARLE